MKKTKVKIHDNECSCDDCKSARVLRLRAVDAHMTRFNGKAAQLLKQAGFKNRCREQSTKGLTRGDRFPVSGVKLGACNPRPDVRPEIPRPSSKLRNARQSDTARGPVLQPLSERAGIAHEKLTIKDINTPRYTVKNGQCVRSTETWLPSFDRKEDSTHGDITGKPGYAAQ